MPWTSGKWVTDVDQWKQANGVRHLSAVQYRRLYREGVFLDCECGFTMAAGIDHYCLDRNRPGEQ